MNKLFAWIGATAFAIIASAVAISAPAQTAVYHATQTVTTSSANTLTISAFSQCRVTNIASAPYTGTVGITFTPSSSATAITMPLYPDIGVSITTFVPSSAAGSWTFYPGAPGKITINGTGGTGTSTLTFDCNNLSPSIAKILPLPVSVVNGGTGVASPNPTATGCGTLTGSFPSTVTNTTACVTLGSTSANANYIAAGTGAPAIVSGDLGASRSTSTGAVVLGGSVSSCIIDYGATTAGVGTFGCAFSNGSNAIATNDGVNLMNNTTSSGTAASTVWLAKDGGATQGLNVNVPTGSTNGFRFLVNNGTSIPFQVTTAGTTTTSKFVSTGATGLSLTNATSNNITYIAAGVGPPTFTTASVGEKIQFYPDESGSTVDFSAGVDSGTVWFATPTTANNIAFYGGTTKMLNITGGIVSVGPATGSLAQTIVDASGSSALQLEGGGGADPLVINNATITYAGVASFTGTLFGNFLETNEGTTTGPVLPFFTNGGVAGAATAKTEWGTCTMSTAVSCTVTLTGDSQFTGANTYACFADKGGNATQTYGLVVGSKAAGSFIIYTTPSTSVSITPGWFCIGH